MSATDYKQAQREAEYASRMVYRPQAGTKIVRDHDGAAFTFINGQARKLQERLTGRAARWRRRIVQRYQASLNEHPFTEPAA